MLFGAVPVVVGGLVLFGGSCAGILRETGYVRTVRTPLRAIGVLFVLVGGLLWGAGTPAWTIHATLRALGSSRIALRGASILAGGVLLTAGGFVGSGWASRIASR